MDIIKSVLSKETFTIMQIIGFNFKKAVGEPLTELIAAMIDSKTKGFSDKAADIQLLNQKREIEFMRVCQNEEAYNRLMNLYKK